MAFCWFTSFEGYPNFFRAEGHGAELARAFITLGEAAQAGTSYRDSKKLFLGIHFHQVETKKAAFQEFGLLYVVPRSDTLTLTPLGLQILELCEDREKANRKRRTVLLALAHGLARYQFNNPLPVGGNRREMRARVQSSDVRPYLACLYLLHKLGGILTAGEFRGAIFGLQRMSNLRAVEGAIRRQRSSGVPFKDLPVLPRNKRTAVNLKIYFLSHLGLDNEIMRLSKAQGPYRVDDQVFELTQLGFEITESVLRAEWEAWRDSPSPIPKPGRFRNIDDYFCNVVGQSCPGAIVESDTRRAEVSTRALLRSVLDEKDVDTLREMPRREYKREYKEGHARFVQHDRLERTRNLALVRDAKFAFKDKHGRLFCEICEFDFEKKYPERGRDYIEAHHRIPISELKESVVLTIEDLTMVCSNCHSMLHRRPWTSVEELQRLVEQTERPTGSAG